MPKKFNFSLENILKYRKSMENDRSINLNNRKIELEREESKLKQINELKEISLEKSRHSGGNLNLLNRKIHYEYLEQMNQNIMKQNRSVQLSEARVEKARQSLQEETQRKKILEKLKDKQYENFKVNFRRQEEKDNSEAALRKNFYKSN
jgi:flagellar FliJ protein